MSGAPLSLRRWQTIAPDGHRVLRLSGSEDHFPDIGKMVLSPYFQMADLRKKAPGRDIRIILALMSRIGVIIGYQNDQDGMDVLVKSWDASAPYTDRGTDGIFFSTVGLTTQAGVVSAAMAAISAFATTNSFTFSTLIDSFDTDTDVSALIAAAVPAKVIASATRSIVTGTGATGFQPSSTRDAFVSYSLTIATTATIGGSASGTVVLEVAPTNSATAGDWVEVARFTNGQSVSLALALQSVQTLAGQVNGMVPAGYYAKLRSINNSGTPTYTYNSGREVLI